MSKRFADTSSVRIAFDDLGAAGDGLAFLCLPGWCVNRGFFRPLAEKLAERHRVLALDWRGHGESSAPPGDFGHAELVDDALSVVESSGASSVIPVAQAHGGWVAIELRRRLGARVPAIVAMSFIVLDPPPPFLNTLRALQDPAAWEQAREQLFTMWTSSAPPAVSEIVRREMGAYGFEMWSRGARSIAAEYANHRNPLSALARIAPPPRSLHLYAQPGAPEFLAAQQDFARQNPWFEVRRLDAKSHSLSLEAPDAAAAEIERFIAGS
jgi:pimeloyl-ACP methyl ester carboxylesterase